METLMKLPTRTKALAPLILGACYSQPNKIQKMYSNLKSSNLLLHFNSYVGPITPAGLLIIHKYTSLIHKLYTQTN